jgi:hypothetical protein
MMVKEKSTKKGSAEYAYWMASWCKGGKVRNVHIGKARKMNAEALGISLAAPQSLNGRAQYLDF